jgi:CRP/FNR family transcriptional regulator, cyclic AMP receptor protein
MMQPERPSHRDVAEALEHAPLDVALLRRADILHNLSDEALERIAEDIQPERFAVGQYIFREGDDASAFFVVLDGEVEVMKRSGRGRDTRIAMLGGGDCFGEMAAIDKEPRSASVRALAPSRLLRLNITFLNALKSEDLKSYATLVMNIARSLSRRLRVADGLVAQVTATVLDEYAGSRRGRNVE